MILNVGWHANLSSFGFFLSVPIEIHLPVIECVGIGMHDSSIGFLYFVHVDLSNTVIIEAVPMAILERFDIAVVVTVSGRPIVYENSIELVHQVTLF